MTRAAWRALDRWLTVMRPHREVLSLLIDGVVIALAWQATYLFRLGFDRWLSARPAYDGWVCAGVVIAYLTVFAALRLPRGVWRFTGFGDIRRLAAACALAGVGCAILVSPVLQLSKVPRAVLALHPFFSLMGVCLVRLLYRMLYEHLQARLQGPSAPQRPVLVLGAGEAARRLVAGIQGQGWRVLGLLDDDPAKRGASVAGVPVLGPVAQVAEQAQRWGATHLILALPSVRGRARRRIIEQAVGSGLPLLTVPSADELLQGTQTTRVRDIRAEDLLGRDPIQLDETPVEVALAGRTVLVTGAGGSIGSELCLQVAAHRPRALVLVELSEFALYAMEQSLADRFPSLEVHAHIGDVKDARQMRHLFSLHRPQVVFHAAAYKHVPLMERHNAHAALLNNTWGTWHAAQAAAEVQAERFVLISTDKAVNPVNVMGATKAAAEQVLCAMAQRHPNTRFMAVRFGNVLGSSGSVIPRFAQQIARGGPVTVTHPDIIRYFMTIPEACRLVLQAGAIGNTAQVLVLDMGEPVRIADLARTMIRLSGHTPEEMPVIFTGLRPGEKLYEEVLADRETTLPTPVELLRVAGLTPSLMGGDLMAWLQACPGLPSDDPQAVRRHLMALVPDYRPAV